MNLNDTDFKYIRKKQTRQGKMNPFLSSENITLKTMFDDKRSNRAGHCRPCKPDAKQALTT